MGYETARDGVRSIASSSDDIDTVTLEIIRGKLVAIADEMGLVLARSSMSPVIYEVLDFACGLCDRDGQLIAQTNGITVFTGIFETQVAAVLAKFQGAIHADDTFLMNNPFEGGTHLCDVCIIRPIFVDGGSHRLRHRGGALERGRRQDGGFAAAGCDRRLSGGHPVPRHQARRPGCPSASHHRHHHGERTPAENVHRRPQCRTCRRADRRDPARRGRQEIRRGPPAGGVRACSHVERTAEPRRHRGNAARHLHRHRLDRRGWDRRQALPPSRSP